MTLIRVAYLGPRGTYSHQAATEAFADLTAVGANVHYSIVGTIGDAIQFLDQPCCSEAGGEAHHGIQEERYSVVPIDNFIHGPVRETLAGLHLPRVPPAHPPESSQVPEVPWTWDGQDCVLPADPGDTPGEESRYNRRIVGHVRLPIQHALLVSRTAWAKYGYDLVLDHVVRVESHEQALGQCQAYLSSHLDHAQRVPVASTALAASHVHYHEDLAAVASPFAAQLYGAHVFAKGVQDKETNSTLFVVLTRCPDHTFRPRA